jgi:hypothetical protein
MKEKGTISDDDLKLYLVTDSVEDAVLYIKNNTIERYGLMPETRFKPSRWLREK